MKDVSIPSWLRRFLPASLGGNSRLERAVLYSVELCAHGANELRHDKAGQMAAALTYHTLFSLLPMLVMAMVVINSIATEEDRDHFIVKVVATALPQTEIGEPRPDEPPAITAQRAELMETRRSLGYRIYNLLNDAKQFVHFSGVGVVGLIVFIYGSTALLATTEAAFNSIFGVPHQRPWYLRLPMYYTVITLGPILLMGGQAVQNQMVDLIKSEHLTAWLAGPAAVISPVLATWLLLFALYALLPNTRVNKKAAAIGAFVGAIFWVASQEAFGLYVRHAGVSKLYGALGLVPLFLMWLYYTWLVILFGGELTYIVQAMKGRTFKHMANKEADEKLLDPVWVVPVATKIAEAFSDGESVDGQEIAQSLSLPARAVHDIIEALEKAHIVHRVEDQAGARFALARPADRISMTQVLESVRQLLPAPPQAADGSPAWQFVQRLHEAVAANTANTMLADMCKKPQCT